MRQDSLLKGDNDPNYKNLKNKRDKLRYYRELKNGKREPIEVKARNGEWVNTTTDGKDRIYYDEEQVRWFSLENNGSVLPMTHGDRDFTQFNNYFLRFWGCILGYGPMRTFEILKSYCYNDTDTCYPSMALISGFIGKTTQTVAKYIDVLEQYGFVCSFQTENLSRKGAKETNIYKIRRSIPFLSEELVQTLPKAVRREHDKYVAQLSQSYTVHIEVESDYDALVEQMMEKGHRVSLPSKSESTQMDLLDGFREVATTDESTITDDIETHDRPEHDPNEPSLPHLQEESRESIDPWDVYLQYMSQKMNAPTFTTWFTDSYMKRVGTELHVYFQSRFQANFVVQRYLEEMKAFFIRGGIEFTEILIFPQE